MNNLERHIKTLIEKGVVQLKGRLSDLGIKATTSNDLLNEAKNIVAQNKQLQNQEAILQRQITLIEQDNNAKLLSSQRSRLDAMYQMYRMPNLVVNNGTFGTDKDYSNPVDNKLGKSFKSLNSIHDVTPYC